MWRDGIQTHAQCMNTWLTGSPLHLMFINFNTKITIGQRPTCANYLPAHYQTINFVLSTRDNHNDIINFIAKVTIEQRPSCKHYFAGAHYQKINFIYGMGVIKIVIITIPPLAKRMEGKEGEFQPYNKTHSLNSTKIFL